MAHYLVHLNPTSNEVVISLDGFGPTAGEGLEAIGAFSLDVDPNSARVEDLSDLQAQGDHPFIVEARKVLHNHVGDDHTRKHYTFVDRATNAVPDADPADTMSTDDMPATEGPLTNPEVSTQPGGVENSQTGEHRPETQQQGESTDDTPATQTATDENQEPAKETVEQLKARIATVTDKAELQAIYDAEVAGQNRPTALKAIEARAKELAGE